ncbi:hypothetical protein HNQ93_003694 [Hymenobacter luteus]|uniref:Uncharacterized protein n=2 Tax=Hymenobacter TaxID=89966 RepID=A0A7W9WCF2_9BACT|nr:MULTISPECIES: hypothetical protein [Hymenobacter]MBB4602927.1 hypothetical protein [Hymenobacter latericoloratus]MBB6060819.1 hypothetical protein [Hymenobacter luteus]
MLAHTLLASYDLLETLRIRLKEGRSFSPRFRSDTAGIVVNEALVAGLGMTQPVGQWLGQARILGVVRDFHYESLHEEVRPLMVRLEPQAGTLMVKLQPGQEQATLGRLQKLYTAYAPGFTLEYQFLETDYQAQYAAERRVAVLSRYFASLAILISCLGLPFGQFAERRCLESRAPPGPQAPPPHRLCKTALVWAPWFFRAPAAVGRP